MKSRPGSSTKRKAGKSRGAKRQGGAKPASAKARIAPDEITQAKSVPPIVGIGASAGGLEAFTQLLRALPQDTGMAFVLVQHLDASHESMLVKLLSGVTQMAVAEVKHGMQAQPNHMYVIPPNADIIMVNGALQLIRREAPAGRHMPIDHFFRSLAQDQGARAIGVVLSGTAADGTLGLKAIKAEGGITFAQEPDSAKYDGMPRSAISASCVDFVLPPDRIATELLRISRHPYVELASQEEGPPLPAGEEAFAGILRLLRVASGVDFTYYKKSTIKRRVARRMALHKIEDLDAYLKRLEGKREELDALYRDILIHVTSFFREPEVFLAFGGAILAKILAGKPAGDAIRVWVPGCSTGEEVYSIAISLMESLGDRAKSTPIQIFGTDISDQAIEYARIGIYPESALSQVSKGRLHRFFTRSNEHHYRINTGVRETCVFARHDLTRDPPFSRLDLISCRNVLIYLESVLQKRVLTTFHYALKDEGFLLLGRSETLGGFPQLFTLMDKKNKFFTKKANGSLVAYAAGSAPYERLVSPESRPPGEPAAFDFEKEVDRVVWERYSHAGFVVNQDLQLLLVRGDTNPYLRLASGRPTLNVLKMLREELAFEIRAAIQNSRRASSAVRRESIRLKEGERLREVHIEVRPLAGPSARERYFLILFEESGLQVEPAEPPAPGNKRKTDDREAVKLKKELSRTKEYLKAIIQEQETTNEELKSANEEALSSMEELQSTNEELETAKEELQSTNEELVTLNEQGQIRNVELAQINDDLANVLSGVNIPILMLGGDCRIRRFTPTAEKLLHLLPGDVGRPIGDIRLHLDIPDIEGLISEVIDCEHEVKREVRTEDGRWYSLRMLPYKTSEQKIDGLLISFGDIDEVKRSQEALRKERNFITTVLDAASTLMVVVLDREKRIVHFNRACQELTGYTLEEVKGRPRDLLMQPEEIAQMNASFEELLHAKQRRDQCYWVAKDGRRRLIAWSNAVTFDDRGLVEYVIRTGIDVTERQEAKEQAQESEATMRALLETAAQAVVAVRRDGRIVLVNAAAETMFGYQREELIGLKVGDLVPQRSREQHAGYQAEYFRQPQNQPMGVAQDLAGVRKNGTEFPIEVSLGHVETRDGTLAVAFVFDITERKRSRDALEQSEARLRSLTAGLLAAQEEERKRLSRDLHDDLNQRMAMLAVGVAELEAGLPDSAGAIREHLLNLETSLKGVSNDLRRTAYQLHPSVLEHLGLAAALEAYCEDVSKLGKIKARFKQHNVPEHIPEAAALCLYRVAQESLGNAVKHSGATRASVNLTGRENELILTISDTGRGFDPSEARKKGGLGLVSMEERVRLAEGILAIRTRPGDGTHVTIRIPLKTGAPC